MGSGRNDDWRVLMEATLVPPAERLPHAETRRPDQRTSKGAELHPSEPRLTRDRD